MLGSRTDGALEVETSWPAGTWTFLTACLLSSSLVSCSAVGALAETHRAERALVSTMGLRSTPAATYALTMSRAYLEKAREEASEAQYGAAIMYAKAAQRAAQEAQRTQLRHLPATGHASLPRFRPAESRTR